MLFAMPARQLRFAAPLGLCALMSLAAFAQGSAPEAAPGLPLPNGNRPYALDTFKGEKQLVPVHSSAVQANNHKGANVAGGLLAGPFYKAKFTTELSGPSAHTAIHSTSPTFYVRVQRADSGEDAGVVAGWAIVHAAVDKDHRLLSTVKFTQFTGSAKRNDSQVDVTIAELGDGWLSITPKAPMPNGEYALLPVTRQENTFSTIVFDFRIDPTAENAADAVTARP